MPWFEHDGRPTAADLTHPVDLLEPEVDDEPERGLSPSQFRRLVIRIARTFFTGNPKITLVAWRIISGDTWESIRACARRAGCTAQAVSQRIGIIKSEFGLLPPTTHRKRLDRWLDRDESKRKRQALSRTPAAPDEDQLKTKAHHADEKGGRL